MSKGKSGKGLLLGILMLGACLFLTACGQSDQENAGLTKAEFVKRANVVCQKGIEERDRVMRTWLAKRAKIGKQGEAPSKSEVKDLVTKALPALRGLAKQLAAVPPPSGNVTPAERIVRQFQQGVEEAEKDPMALVNADPFQGASKAASSYGLKACNL